MRRASGLQRCSFRGASSSFDDDEVIAVQQLEAVNPIGFTLRDLERASEHANTPITNILLASTVERALGGVPLEDAYNELGACVEGVCSDFRADKPSDSLDTLVDVFEWTKQEEEQLTHEQEYGLKRFYIIMSSIYPDYEYPCGQVEGDGFATWRELRVHARRFMETPRISISSMIELLRFLRRRPYMNCTVSAKAGVDASTLEQEEQDLAVFDVKLEKARDMYPIVDKLADPPLVIIEPLAGGPPPPQVQALIATLGAATICPLPSGVLPVPLPDLAGPPGAVFSYVYRLHNLAEAKTFAGMLRTALADATTSGGAGPATRLVVANTGATGFRVF